jgi:hypothetical protein
MDDAERAKFRDVSTRTVSDDSYTEAALTLIAGHACDGY